MKDQSKTKQVLIQELASLRQIIAEMEQTEPDRKRQEENIRRFVTVVKDSNDAITIQDFEGRITAWNHGAELIYGYNEEEALRMNIWQLTPPDKKLEQKEFTRRLVAGETITSLETQRVTKDGRIIDIWITVTKLVDDAGKPIGIASTERDITHLKKNERSLKEALKSLRNALGATLQVIVSVIEERDPYTAGHQFRSANLVRTIAAEISFAKDRIDAIRMAGSIHDIGKLSIPAEILAKPTKLTELEFSFIKEHPRRGYEILKNVESRWPLAEIVYQHHERMDGSGYPRNLKGDDDILIEARILAVADVVEAMASHRPYRPSLGIGVALEEIEKNRGTLYDNSVVDACLKLFREKGFHFEQARF